MTIDNAFAAAQAGKCLAEMGNQKLRARLELFDESIVLTRYENGAAVSAYEVSPDALATAFSGLPVITGVLPDDCLFYAGAGSVVRLGIYLAPQTRALEVDAKDMPTLTIPLPGMVFVGNGRTYQVFAVKQRPTEGSERLFHAPLPNVYDDGRICCGTVNFPVCSGKTIHEAARLFFASAFNNDLSGGKCRSQPDNVLALWKTLAAQGANEFPPDELKKTSLKLEELYAA